MALVSDTLQTERLILRMLRDDDLDAYAELYGDAEAARFIGGEGRALTRAEAWRNMAMVRGHWELRGYGMWAAVERSSQAVVGRIGFFEPEGWPGFELGWALLRRYWGRGFATEGARAALEHAFTTMGRDHVISVIHPENARSIRVAERLGERLQRTVQLNGGTQLLYRLDRQTTIGALTKRRPLSRAPARR